MSQLDQLVAYEQIRQLASRYALAVNQRDLDGLVELFIDDVAAGRGRSGRDALKEHFDAQLRSTLVDVLEVTTQVIDLVDADHANGTVYSRCELGDEERWVRQSIAYEDEYERRDGTWHFVRRVHLLFYGVDASPSPLAQKPAHWPQRVAGRGTLPFDWPSWQSYRSSPEQT